MAWRRPGDKPLSEPMVVSLLTHISVARPQWDKGYSIGKHLSNWNTYVVKYIYSYNKETLIPILSDLQANFFRNIYQKSCLEYEHL